jgi:hypothetical protein
MVTADESESDVPLQLLNNTLETFMNGGGPGASAADFLAASLDSESIVFESGDLSSEWLNDIFSDPHGLLTDLDPQMTAPSKAIRCEPDVTFAEAQTCQNPQGLCASLATGLLNSMHPSSPSCLLDTGDADAQPQPPVAVDNILSSNQRALQSLRGFLGCPCYTNPQLQLLITAICAETINWYWRIVHTYSRHSTTNVDNGLLLTDRVETRRRSFSVGDHSLESHLETTLISQVLSSRLQELDDFIEQLSWNGEESGALKGESRTCPMAMLCGVHTRLNSFLNGQLSAVRRGLLNLLDNTATEGLVLPGTRN